VPLEFWFCRNPGLKELGLKSTSLTPIYV